MKLAPRTTLILLLVAGLPVGLAGWTAIRSSDAALRERAHELHRVVARSVAEKVRDGLDRNIQAVQDAALAHDFLGLSPAGRRGALQLVFRQIEGASVVVLLSEDGAQVAGPIHLAAPSREPGFAGRPVADQAAVDRFAQNIPALSSASEVSASIGPPYVSPDGQPRLAVLARTRGGLLMAVELSLEGLLAAVRAANVGARGHAFVTDPTGQVVFADDPRAVAEREDRSGWTPVAAMLKGRGEVPAFEHPGVGPALGAAATVERYGWLALVSEPRADALAAARALARNTLWWVLVAALFAVVLGLFSARSLVKPIHTLQRGARALESGKLDHRVDGADRGDELGEVAGAFNAMAEEIQRWNRELEDRVEEKTRELQEAQDMLVRSQKLAAVGELGAGVAHEINNPLTGVLGMVQLLLMSEQEGSPLARRLGTVEREAKRIQEIVENLQRLTTDLDAGDRVQVRIEEAIDGALSLTSQALESAGIEVVKQYDEGVPPVYGDLAQLSEAFLALIRNAQTAMPDGGRLDLKVSSDRGQLVRAQVVDTGVGIAKDVQSRIFEPFFTDRKNWGAKGMGLSVVSKVVENHDGRILVDSDPGDGASFTLLFPAMQRRSLE